MPPAPSKNPHVVDPDVLKDLWKYNLSEHELTTEGKLAIQKLRNAAITMTDCIISLTPAGRDQAMALSSQEQALFHAVAAVERQHNTQVEKPAEEDKK